MKSEGGRGIRRIVGRIIAASTGYWAGRRHVGERQRTADAESAVWVESKLAPAGGEGRPTPRKGKRKGKRHGKGGGIRDMILRLSRAAGKEGAYVAATKG